MNNLTCIETWGTALTCDRSVFHVGRHHDPNHDLYWEVDEHYCMTISVVDENGEMTDVFKENDVEILPGPNYVTDHFVGYANENGVDIYIPMDEEQESFLAHFTPGEISELQSMVDQWENEYGNIEID